MKNENSMTVNRLPAPTWRWLKMNGTRLKAPAGLTNLPPVPGQTPGIRIVNEEDIPQWQQIETGCGPEPDILSAGCADGTPISVLTLPENTASGEPLLLPFSFSDGSRTLSRLFIHARKNSCARVSLVLTSPKEAEGFCFLQIKVLAEEGARVFVDTVQLLAAGFTCVNDFGGLCGADAEITLTRLELGADRLFGGGLIALSGKGSRCEMNIGYLAGTDQRLDMNYTARHIGKKTGSEIRASGVLTDGAFKILRGTIDFIRGCSGSKGSETEQVLLLGERLANQSVPLILCSEEDVEGEHGASLGRLDEAVLFYLGSRGISREEAERIMTRARIEAVSQLIPSGDIQRQVSEFLDEREGLPL